MSSQTRRRRLTVMSGDVNDHMDVDQGSGQLTANHQLLLQYLMHYKMVKKLEISQVHNKLFNNDESLSDSLRAITNTIDKLKMDIKEIKFDVTGETYYVIVHTTGESFFPRCSVFSKSQLDFLKKILTTIVLSSDGMIGKIEAINSCRSMSKSDADESLRLFEEERILWGKEDNLSTCDLCKQLVFVGRVCPSEECGLKFHHHCVSKWADKRSHCPKCQAEWKFCMQEDTE